VRIVLLGAPGCGKGTQGDLLSRHWNVPRISTGDALRAARRDGTALGMMVAPLMDAGMLVPDHLVLGIVEERLSMDDAKRGYILDGFPRSATQAVALDAFLEGRGLPPVSKAVLLEVDTSEIFRRLHSRALSEGRSDDKPEVILSRISTYNAELRPLLDYYTAQEKLAAVPGVGRMEEIFVRILQACGKVEERCAI
jgi:adenylate kinase